MDEDGPFLDLSSREAAEMNWMQPMDE
jgi:hypothetical protein